MVFRVNANELDVEPGEVIVPPANRDAVRIVSWFLSVTFLLSFAVEFHQELVSIRTLKESTPLSLACLESSTPAMTWLERMAFLYSGLEDVHARECQEQLRVHSLLSFPNPFIVLVNLLWRGFVGDNAAVVLTRLLSQQTYVVQASLILVTAAVVGLVVYNLILALPSWVASVAQSRDTRRREVYEDLQLQLQRQTLSEQGKTVMQQEAIKRKKREQEEKIAVYREFMRNRETSLTPRDEI
jgi:hypothetical protein